MNVITMHPINTPTPVKYKDLIAEVREAVHSGTPHTEAVESVLATNWHKFENIEDQDRLRAWLLGTFGNLAA